MSRHEGGYYVRLDAQDRPGAAAAIATRMADRGISLESIMQRGRRDLPKGAKPPEVMPVVLITYATTERLIREALADVVTDGFVSGRPQVIRIERE